MMSEWGCGKVKSMPVQAFEVGFGPSKAHPGPVGLRSMLCKTLPLQTLPSKRPAPLKQIVTQLAPVLLYW